MTRRYFGTDGVRGVVGADLTPELVERIGKAATLWGSGGRVLVGRDTRGSGPELEQAVARGIVSAGGVAVLGGVLPTPAVAFLADELGVVISASHNPPEYNGVKIFRSGGKLIDEQEEEIEALLDGHAAGGGTIEERIGSAEAYLAHVLASCGSDLTGLRIGLDCANGAFSALAPRVVLSGSAPRCTRSARSRTAPTSTSAAAPPTCVLCNTLSRARLSTWASPSTGTVTGCSRSTVKATSSTATRSWPCSHSPSASTSSR